MSVRWTRGPDGEMVNLANRRASIFRRDEVHRSRLWFHEQSAPVMVGDGEEGSLGWRVAERRRKDCTIVESYHALPCTDLPFLAW